MKLSTSAMVFSSAFLLISSLKCSSTTPPAAPAADISKNDAPPPAANNSAPVAEAIPAPVTEPAVSSPVDSAAIVVEPVYFEFDSYSLTSATKETLRKIAGSIKQDNKIKLQIEGHCDERGSNEYNLALGERRARSIQEFLLSESVSSAALSTISYGEERPASQGSGETVWSKNRRGEFKTL